jgi:hypothetical protein
LANSSAIVDLPTRLSDTSISQIPIQTNKKSAQIDMSLFTGQPVRSVHITRVLVYVRFYLVLSDKLRFVNFILFFYIESCCFALIYGIIQGFPFFFRNNFSYCLKNYGTTPYLLSLFRNMEPNYTSQSMSTFSLAILFTERSVCFRNYSVIICQLTKILTVKLRENNVSSVNHCKSCKFAELFL